MRIFLVQHVTFSVNSICHMFGKREFATNDQSHNEWIVGLLAFGEGWHNNHHAFPRSAFHGLHWWQFDLSSYIIWTLERLGLVHDVYRIPPALLDRRSSAKVS
jgi:stearoyl-CoA desaturase (delta-9 desaturase)